MNQEDYADAVNEIRDAWNIVDRVIVEVSDIGFLNQMAEEVQRFEPLAKALRDRANGLRTLGGLRKK